jgi:hypothetical protein
MATDTELQKWRHLKYVSMRLARRYLEWLEGASSRVPISTSLKIPFGEVGEVSLDTSPEGLQSAMNNPYLAARVLDDRLRDVYLDLTRPGVRPERVVAGVLIKAELLTQPAHLQVQNYELVHPTVDPYYVVAFAVVDRLPSLGRVFIGLVGSERNLLSMPGDGTIAARSASDSRGLYEMIQYTKEADAIDISPEDYHNEFSVAYEDVTEDERLRLAAEAFSGFHLQHAPRPMEMLFEVHHVVRDIELESLDLHQFGKGRMSLAVIGAPVWVRESTDRTLLSTQDMVSGPEEVEALWVRLDESLNAAIRDATVEVDWVPGSAEEWRHFGEWAVAYSKRVGPDLLELVFEPAKHRVLGREFGGPSGSVESTGANGWLTSYWDVAYFLSEAGELYVAVERDGAAFYVASSYGRPAPIAWDDPEARTVVEAMVDRLVTWLTPFGRRS